MRSFSQSSENTGKIGVFIEMFRNFIQAGECFYVMENGSKIKIVNNFSAKIWGRARCEFRVAGCGFRVKYKQVQRFKDLVIGYRLSCRMCIISFQVIAS
jgi:hypothetical protein